MVVRLRHGDKFQSLIIEQNNEHKVNDKELGEGIVVVNFFINQSLI